MKRVLLGFVLALALVLAVGSASFATPVATGDAGSLIVYGEYGPGLFLSTFYAGLGYTLADGITIGGLVGYEEVLFEYGAFAVLGLGPIAINAELVTTSSAPGFWGQAHALFMFDLDPIKIGVGAGMAYVFGSSAFTVAGSVSVNLDSFAVFGTVDYSLDTAAMLFEVGVSLSF
ncbi:MAG: hypothetical protein ACM3X6_06225 [Patescibacteria group bacterium]